MVDQREQSDEDLVINACENKEYFGILIERYEDKLVRYIKRITSYNNDDITDILQNTFIKAYINLNSFNHDLKFSSWIYRISHNEAISFHRSKKSKPSISIEEEDLVDTLISDTDIETEYLDNEERQNILNSINLLPDKYKDVIVLKFLEDKDYVEISDILKIPEGTVATRINRAKSKLKEAVKEKKHE